MAKVEPASPSSASEGAPDDVAPAVAESTASLPPAPAPRLAEVQRRLASIGGFVDEAIPPSAQPLLVELRQTSIALIRQVVSHVAERRGVATLSDDDLEKAIAEAASREGVTLIAPGDERDDDNGTWLADVTRSKANPRYLVVGFHFRIPCGSDGGFVVYDRAARGTDPILTVTSPDADTIEPAFWSPSFAFSPPGSSSRVVFAIARLTPWCQSAQRRMQLLVVAPSGDPLHPKRLIDETMSHHLQKPHRLKVEERSITWETHDGIQAQVQRWRRSGDGFAPM